MISELTEVNKCNISNIFLSVSSNLIERIMCNFGDCRMTLEKLQICVSLYAKNQYIYACPMTQRLQKKDQSALVAFLVTMIKYLANHYLR